MRRFLCLLLGHRFGEPEHVLGFRVRRCLRCGVAEPLA
jgi:hypothetical protein